MSSLHEIIILTLQSGPMSGTELASRLQVDPTTVGRQLKRFSNQVIRAGAGRATRWYLSRSLPLLNNVQMLPIYRVNVAGEAEKIAHLHAVYPSDTYLVEDFRSSKVTSHTRAPEWSYYESLPWWLTDMRPQGFLGRSFANQLRSNGEPVDSDPRVWTEDQVLAILVKYPQDHVGNLLVGDQAYTQWLQAEQQPVYSDLEAAEKADAISRGAHFDSSAQGEQPKFTAQLGEGECIVKFSGQVAQTDIDSVANRWADLLHTEAVAAAVLNNVLPGSAAINRSFNQKGRTLLASQRFDRVSEGGRVGIISLASLDAEFVGRANEPWPVLIDALHREHVVTEKAVLYCKVVWAFGQLIANSDMHLGNASVINKGGRPYELAPIYDMLPMHYAPKTSGDLPSEPFQVRINTAVSRVHWEAAYSPAIQFWQHVLNHTAISTHFKSLAQSQLQITKDFANVIERMA